MHNKRDAEMICSMSAIGISAFVPIAFDVWFDVRLMVAEARHLPIGFVNIFSIHACKDVNQVKTFV
jgi:hypothetical protein